MKCIYRIIIFARRNKRIRIKAMKGQNNINAIAPRRKPDNGNHRNGIYRKRFRKRFQNE
jgi:hypothetical protein